MACDIAYLWRVVTPPNNLAYGIYYDGDIPSNYQAVAIQNNLGVYSYTLLQSFFGNLNLAPTLDNLRDIRLVECLAANSEVNEKAIINQIVASQNMLNNSISNSTGTVLFGMEQ